MGYNFVLIECYIVNLYLWRSVLEEKVETVNEKYPGISTKKLSSCLRETETLEVTDKSLQNQK